MKKQYIVPFVEIVNVRLIGSVLETGNMGNDSDETGVINTDTEYRYIYLRLSKNE